jgi:hypothetical protein
MQSPGKLSLNGDRWTPFVRTLQFEGVDFTDAVFKLQVRDRKDGGAIRADLATVATGAAEGVRLIYGGTDTVANHISAGRIDEVPDGMTTSTTLPLSLVGIRINESTMEGMTPAQEIGGDAQAWWDLHVTPSGALKELYLFGPFTIRAGVTE